MLRDEKERLHREWSAWADSSLGRDPHRTEAAATAAVEALAGGLGYGAAMEAAKEAWRTDSPNPSAGPGARPPSHESPDPSLTKVAASKPRQNVVGESSPDGAWQWDGNRWIPTARPAVAHHPRFPRRGQRFAAVLALLAGWFVCIAFGSEVSGAVANLTIALVVSAGAVLLIIAAARPTGQAWQRRGAGATTLGAGVTVVMAPIWIVRPFFADEGGVARGIPISTSAEAVWLLFAIISSVVVATLALFVGQMAGATSLASTNLDGGSGYQWWRTIRWRRLLWFSSVCLIFSVGTAVLSVDAAKSDQIPATDSTVLFLPYGQLSINCPGRSMPEYVDNGVSVAQRSGGRSLAESWRLMTSNGVIEASVGLLVTTQAQCSHVVDTDPWIETMVFRFDSSAHALKMYQAGLLGIVPVANPRKQQATEPDLGWANDLNASWMEFVDTGSQTQFTAFWPFANYLVFFICRNVDVWECRNTVHPVGVDYSSSSIDTKLDNAFRRGKWFYAR